jgi:uncharacterized protein
MKNMRQANLECTDEGKINSFLTEKKTGYLGLTDQNIPYVVPLNYVWFEGDIYFHGASEGRKVDIIGVNPSACFTVSEDLGTMTDPVPAKTDTAYMSVMIFGKIEKVVEWEKATSVMQVMLDKYVPGYYVQRLSQAHVEKYRSSLGSRTAVFRIKTESLTAKENPLQMGAKFYNGKDINND